MPLSRLAAPAALTLALAVPASAHAASGYQANVLAGTPAPDVYWTLDDARGTTAADLTGRHDGDATGVDFGAGPAFALAGTSAELHGAGAIETDPAVGERAVELWVRPRITNVQQTIVRQGDGAGDGWELGIGPKRKLLFTSNGRTVNSRITVPAGRWTNVVVGWSAESVRFLTNGGYSQDKTRPATATVTSPSSTRVVLGSGALGRFDGRVDEVALYAQAPADLEVLARDHYAATALPRNLTLPAIGGPLREGATLTLTAGTWESATSVEHQWMRCDPADVCADVPGATGATYALGHDDVGSTFVVQERALNGAGESFVVSPETEPVAPSAPGTDPTPDDGGTGTGATGSGDGTVGTGTGADAGTGAGTGTDTGTGTATGTGAGAGTGAGGSTTGTGAGDATAAAAATGEAPVVAPVPAPGTTTTTPPAATAPACVIGPQALRSLRRARVRGAGRVALRVRTLSGGRVRVELRATKTVQRRLAKVVFKLDKRVLKGRARSLTRTSALARLAAGTHRVTVTVRPKRGRAKAVRLAFGVKGC